MAALLVFGTVTAAAAAAAAASAAVVAVIARTALAARSTLARLSFCAACHGKEGQVCLCPWPHFHALDPAIPMQPP